MAKKFMKTSKLMELALKADKKGFNRRVNVDELEKDVDPDGIHIVNQSSLTGPDGREIIRAEILLKLKNQDDPYVTWLDIELDEFNNLEAVR